MNIVMWVLTGCGVSLILFGVLYGIFKADKTHSYLEMLPIMEQRKQDLPEVKISLAQYISQIEYLAENDNRLYDLEQYKSVYFKNGIKGIRKYNPPDRMKLAYYWELYQREKVWKDNIIFRSIVKEDKLAGESLNKLNYYIPIITDKKLRKHLQGIIKASYVAYSLVIWFNLGDRILDTNPQIIRGNVRKKEFWLNYFRNICSRANRRIEELLGGAEDT